MIQWLELGAFTMVAQVQSLVGELISHKREKKINKLLELSWWYSG